jgi:two-component system sensor histidine kinase/response regulator
MPDAAVAALHRPDLRVLIVDDNTVNRRILSEQATRWGMTPTQVETGRAAIDAMTTAARLDRPFDLVLLDANMPGMDGFAVAEVIAGERALAGATVMMLTSSGEFGDQSRCAELGIAVYLTKPVYAGDLLAAIERALGAKASAVAAPKAARLNAGTMAMAASGRRIRILLVEDNIVNQRVAEGLLTRRGHEVTVAQHGGEALAFLERARFDLVLMDLQMPVMGGIEATSAIRTRERVSGGHTRIVAMTAHAMTGDRERCLQAGMNGHLSKPIDPQVLFAVVEQQPDGGDATARIDDHAGPVFDETALLERLCGDTELMSDVIGAFIEDCPALVVAIKDAIARRHAVDLCAGAHALKGMAANLSATRLFDVAHVLERIGAESRPAAAEGACRQLCLEASQVIDALRQSLRAREPLRCAS